MNIIKKNSLHIAWIVAGIAFLGSLYFSNVLNFAPCVLCWYQRILLYPLVIILPISIFYKDRFIYRYVLPTSIIGLIISIYHNLLYWKIIPESSAPCEAGVSCTTKFIQYFGFITIPFLSLLAFLSITVLMFIYKNYSKKENHE